MFARSCKHPITVLSVECVFSAMRSQPVFVRSSLLRGRAERQQKVPMCRLLCVVERRRRHSAGSGVWNRLGDL